MIKLNHRIASILLLSKLSIVTLDFEVNFITNSFLLCKGNRGNINDCKLVCEFLFFSCSYFYHSYYITRDVQLIWWFYQHMNKNNCYRLLCLSVIQVTSILL